MIKRIEFTRFRGFERLRAELLPHAYIVGPNSAGKSTILEAIQLAMHCLGTVKKAPSLVRQGERGRRIKVYAMPRDIENLDDPVRFDFGSDETRLTVEATSGGRIHLVWPEETRDGSDGYFYIDEVDGTQPSTPDKMRALFDATVVVPVVTPLERYEELKNPAYVEKQADTRLASRHFRNHAWRMHQAGTWEQFKSFCRIWLPEITLLDVALNTNVNRLAVFYSEAHSRIPKELAWAGDGMQIWVQLLWHIHRAQSAATVVLDEPEVYLHPDLQRRLVRLLDSTSAQVVLASHSADVLAESPPEGVLWVDRIASSARRPHSRQSVAALNASLGSSYGLAVARTMRARAIIASDAGDIRAVRQLGVHSGITELLTEHALQLLQFTASTRWEDRRGLGEALRSLLLPGTPAFILLGHGYRSAAQTRALVEALGAAQVSVLLWSRVDFESFLLEPAAIARAAGAAKEKVAWQLEDVIRSLCDVARAEHAAIAVSGLNGSAARVALEEANAWFDERWAVQELRITLVRGATVIEQMNRLLEAEKYPAVTAHAIAKAMRPNEVPLEVMSRLRAAAGMLK
jgi:hypothetical protein